MELDAVKIAAKIGVFLEERKLKLVCAESCTGGMISQIITANSGASNYFDRAFITYSDRAKEELLGVEVALLDVYGAVSEETALAMAEGALHASEADVALAVTGIAGPTGGTPDKPVGTVCFAWVFDGKQTVTSKQFFTGNRHEIRSAAASFALEELLNILHRQN